MKTPFHIGAAMSAVMIAGTAQGGGYAMPVVALPYDAPVEVAQEAAAICAILLALIIAGLAGSDGGNDTPIVRPVDPVPEPIPEPTCPQGGVWPVCTVPQGPVDPAPPAPVPLPPAGALLGGSIAIMVLWRRLRRINVADWLRGTGWAGHDKDMPTGGYAPGSAILG